MKKNEKITIFTVNWNGKKWLKKYLDSVENQTYPNIENIVVDNASNDGSVEFIKKYYPKVKIIQNKKNFGLAKATQIGVKNAKGKYILFINNDTWFNKAFVSDLFEFYQNNNYTVVSAREERYFDNKKFNCNTTIDLTGSPAYFKPAYSKPHKIFYLTVCFLCLKDDFIKSKGTDEDFFMYYEDVDWFWRLTLLGKKFRVAEKIKIHHAGAGSSGSGIRYDFFLWRNQNSLQSLIKNYSSKMLLVTLPLFVLQNIFEIIFFLVILKPKISYSYIEGWIFNLKNVRRTLKKRKWIQNNRIVGDLEVIKKMYIGPSKLKTLLNH